MGLFSEGNLEPHGVAGLLASLAIHSFQWSACTSTVIGLPFGPITVEFLIRRPRFRASFASHLRM